MALKAFCTWLAATPVSLVIQNVTWIIPSTQSIHIMSIAVLLAAMVTIDLRLVGMNRSGPSLAALRLRFMPWFWGALAVLLCTGTVLAVGEPARELMNWLFYTKMILVLGLAALAGLFQWRITADAQAFDSAGTGQLSAKALGGTSLLLIMAIIAAGRWIAYVVVAGG